jgi:rhodanese-related sulfurtransferase
VITRCVITVLVTAFPLLVASVAVSPAYGNTAAGEVAPAETGGFVVDEDDFEGRRLAWSYFQALAERDDVMIIDVRTGFLPGGIPSGLEKVRPIPLDIFLANFVARKVHQDRMLLIFDEIGEAHHRLQFNLQKHGYKNYFFLDGGAEGALNRQKNGS